MVSEQDRRIGAKVRELRRAANISQSKLAEMVGASRGLVAHLEDGEQSWTAKHMTAFAKALGVGIDAIFAEVPECEAVGAGVNAEVGRRVKRLRIAAGMNQQQLAARMGLHQTQVSRLETDRQEWTAAELMGEDIGAAAFQIHAVYQDGGWGAVAAMAVEKMREQMNERGAIDFLGDIFGDNRAPSKAKT